MSINSEEPTSISSHDIGKKDSVMTSKNTVKKNHPISKTITNSKAKKLTSAPGMLMELNVLVILELNFIYYENIFHQAKQYY